MVRTLTAAGTLAIAAVMVAGVAHANPPQQNFTATAPQVAQGPKADAIPVRWRYEWQYHYTKWGQYEPTWVAVPTYLR